MSPTIRLRDGQVEVVIATDVAARGLDVERISHVINHDVAFDAESYLHRVGRTGRAGRAGTAILFVTPRETRLLKTIERFTGQRIAPMRMPTAEDVAARRVQSFKARLRAAVSEDGLKPYLALVEELSEEAGLDITEIAAAARLAAGDRPLTVEALPAAPQEPVVSGRMLRLFVDAGREAGIRPGDIVGAIAGPCPGTGSMWSKTPNLIHPPTAHGKRCGYDISLMGGPTSDSVL